MCNFPLYYSIQDWCVLKEVVVVVVDLFHFHFQFDFNFV